MGKENIYDGETTAYFHTSEKCKPSMLAMIAKVMETNTYAQQYKKLTP
jgi:hypothetical protein